MRASSAVSARQVRADRISALAVWFVCVALSGTAHAHGGGLDANGCHTNRKTGEYHCHRGGGRAAVSAAPDHNATSARTANSFASTGSASPGLKCYTGPRGGTYTITASGRKNYGGC
ncbi:YHYH domain-containing protein [Cupriavidus sp. 8B]